MAEPAAPTRSHLHESEQALILAGLGVVGFSLTLPMTKIVVRGLDPVLAASGRAAVASALAGLVLVATRRARPRGGQWGALVLVAGGVVVGFPMLTSYAIRSVPASHGAVVIGLLPLATAGLAVVRVGERPSVRYWVCSVAGLGAVVAFAVHEGGGTLHGADALLLLAVAVAAIAYMEGALLARTMAGWEVISWALVVSAPVTLVLTVVALAQSPPDGVTAGQWLAFGYVSSISQFAAFFAWYAGLARAGIARAGQLQLTQPVLTILWSWPLLSEGVTLAAALTAVVVLVAVAFGRRADIAPPPLD